MIVDERREPFDRAARTAPEAYRAGGHGLRDRERLRRHSAAARRRLGDPALAAGTTVIKAAHVSELRTSLRQAYVRAGLAQPAFTDDPLTAGTTPKTVHITELRGAVTAVAGGAATYTSAAPTANMASGAITLTGSISPAAGGNQPHDNRQPCRALNYCISLFGIFPPMA